MTNEKTIILTVKTMNHTYIQKQIMKDTHEKKKLERKYTNIQTNNDNIAIPIANRHLE